MDNQAGSNRYQDDGLFHAEHGIRGSVYDRQASYTPTGLHTQAYVLFSRKFSKLMGSLIFELFESIPGPLFFTASVMRVSDIAALKGLPSMASPMLSEQWLFP